MDPDCVGASNAHKGIWAVRAPLDFPVVDKEAIFASFDIAHDRQVLRPQDDIPSKGYFPFVLTRYDFIFVSAPQRFRVLRVRPRLPSPVKKPLLRDSKELTEIVGGLRSQTTSAIQS